MGVDEIDHEILKMQYQELLNSKGGFTFGVFKEMVKDFALQFKKQDNKHYVLLSLQEAEHFRGVMHARKDMSLLLSEATQIKPGTSAGLWLMGDFNMVQLATSKAFEKANRAQHSSMVNSFRFVNSDTHFDNNGLTVLLRVLESDTTENREKWWVEVRSCRRRRQIQLDGSFPIVTVFNTENEYDFMEFKATVDRVRNGLHEKGMLIFDAFRAFNSSHTGLMTCSELYGGLDFLGIPFTAQQIYALVKKIAIQNEVRELRINNIRRKWIHFVSSGLNFLRRLQTSFPIFRGRTRIESDVVGCRF